MTFRAIFSSVEIRPRSDASVGTSSSKPLALRPCRASVGVDRTRNMAHVYILKSENGTFYIGSTDNLERRLKQHASGQTQTTRQKKIYKLVFEQKFSTLANARKIEKRIKKWKRKDYIEKIIQDGYIKKVN